MTDAPALSHLDGDGRARMVDVSHKAVTKRTATAMGRFSSTAEVISLVRADDLPKADVLATARIAGIQGAKRTSELIPLCHQLALNSVTVDFEFGDNSIMITASATTTGKTGVEMEALAAVSAAKRSGTSSPTFAAPMPSIVSSTCAARLRPTARRAFTPRASPCARASPSASLAW